MYFLTIFQQKKVLLNAIFLISTSMILKSDVIVNVTGLYRKLKLFCSLTMCMISIFYEFIFLQNIFKLKAKNTLALDSALLI